MFRISTPKCPVCEYENYESRHYVMCLSAVPKISQLKWKRVGAGDFLSDREIGDRKIIGLIFLS